MFESDLSPAVVQKSRPARTLKTVTSTAALTVSGDGYGLQDAQAEPRR